MSAGNPQVLVRAAALRVAAGRRRCGIRVCEGWLTPGLDPGPLWAQRALGTPGVGALGAPLQAHGPDKGTIKTVLPRRRVPPSPVLGSRGLGPIPVASVGVRSPAHVRQGARVRRPTARLSPWGPLVLTPLRGASPLGGPGRHAGPPSPGAHLHTIPRGVCPDVSLGPESGVGPVEGTLTDEIAPGGAGPGTSRHHGRGPWSAGTRAGVRRVFSQKRVPVNVLNVLRRRHRGGGVCSGGGLPGLHTDRVGACRTEAVTHVLQGARWLHAQGSGTGLLLSVATLRALRDQGPHAVPDRAPGALLTCPRSTYWDWRGWGT